MKYTALLSLLLGMGSKLVYAEDQLSATLNESVIKIPTTVKTIFNQEVSKDMVVTQFKPNGDGPFPIVVLLHGRSYKDRSKPGRERFLQVSRYFVNRGFAVWVPTRIGYGDSGIDPDPEYSGTCSGKMYVPAYEAAATATLTVIAYAKQQSYVDPTRIVVLGQSYGGATAMTVAAKNPPGLIAAINFAGGGGGNPDTQPYEPCRPDLLKGMFGVYGKTARVPSLWIYTENDKYFGPTYPKQWFAEYQKQSSVSQLAEYQAMPAFGDNGHYFFSRAFSTWRPIVDNFLQRQGVLIPQTPGNTEETGFAKINELASVPVKNAELRDKYVKFLESDIPRAFVVDASGEFGAYFGGTTDALEKALALCKKRAQQECAPYAVDDRVVWKKPTISAQTDKAS
ncbi:dienelactone hydrolase family protein [Undibacterium sp. RuRC25W]|uniref:dienelactone hydrolase family protein n=1 Tax=Undibacterium sp. RuRC25W TaxID=3413047 RepID=UPI003BF28529